MLDADFEYGLITKWQAIGTMRGYSTYEVPEQTLVLSVVTDASNRQLKELVYHYYCNTLDHGFEAGKLITIRGLDGSVQVMVLLKVHLL